MWVKTLVDEEGRYIKNYALEKIFGVTPWDKPQILCMGYWLTDNPYEALHFHSSIEAVVAHNYLPWTKYKNIEITYLQDKI